MSTTARVLTLRCEKCGGPLDGLPDDAIFNCTECCLGHEATMKGYETHPLHYWQPARRESGTLIYLPFWAFTVQVEILSQDPEKAGRYTVCGDEERVYVKGFSLLNCLAAGNPGLDLTTARVRSRKIDLDRPRPPILGCRRSSREAERFVKLFLLAIMDREEDVTGVDLEIEVRDLHIVAIPYRDDQRDLTCTVTGKRYPAPLWNDIHSLREGSRS